MRAPKYLALFKDLLKQYPQTQNDPVSIEWNQQLYAFEKTKKGFVKYTLLRIRFHYRCYFKIEKRSR